MAARCPVPVPKWASDRMKQLLLATALIGATLPALAQTPLGQPPLTAEQFEAHVTGKTVTYSQFGQPFGIEEYLPGRQVRWSVAENRCQYGFWYPREDQICFVYEDDPTPHCWTFRIEGGALRARLGDSPPGADLAETDRSETPLGCPGPDIGA